MAELVALAASIVSFLTLAETVHKHLKSAYSSFSNAQSHLDHISREIESITIVIHELDVYVSRSRQSNDSDSAYQHKLLAAAVSNTTNILDGIHTKLVRLQRASPKARKWKRVQWIWEQQEFERTLVFLQRQKNTLILGLSVLGT